MTDEQYPPEERKVKYIQIPIDIWLDKRLTMNEKGILAEIDSLDGDEGCWASNEYLADFCVCSKATVTRAISKLIELGYVYRCSFNGRRRLLRTAISHPLPRGVSLLSLSSEGNQNEEADSAICASNNIDRSLIDDNNSLDISVQDSSRLGEGKRTPSNAGSPKPAHKKKFVPPTVAEIAEYCKSRGNGIDPQYFFDYYAVNDWHDKNGKPVQNWKQRVISWEGNRSNGKKSITVDNNDLSDYD